MGQVEVKVRIGGTAFDAPFILGNGSGKVTALGQDTGQIHANFIVSGRELNCPAKMLGSLRVLFGLLKGLSQTLVQLRTLRG